MGPVKPGQDVQKSVSLLRDRVELLIHRQKSLHPRQRLLIALAGVPGSGKSTISDALLHDLTKHGIEHVAVLPMDGFHYTKASLSSFNDPELAFRKRGAPFTFDVEALLKHVAVLKRLPVTECDEPETIVKAPSFDHAEKDPIFDAINMSSTCKLVIIEGNYTLLDERPWNQIADMVDEKWFVDVIPEVARERIAQRHLKAGIETTRDAALLRAEDNDLPNGDLIRNNLIEPDVRILN